MDGLLPSVLRTVVLTVSAIAVLVVHAFVGLDLINGKLIERPVLRSMYSILAIAERVGAG